MKKRIAVLALICLLLTGCGSAQSAEENTTAPAAQTTAPAETTQPVEGANTVLPLPDTTMENLDDCTAAVSFSLEDFRQTDSGAVLLRMQVYSYDQFDMVDIAALKAGDTIVIGGQEVAVASVERNESGTVLINGGMDQDGYDLITEDNGIFYVRDYSDMKWWNMVGDAEYQVADDFVFTDSSNLEIDPVTYTAGEFLAAADAIDDYFRPQNTTVRIENGQIVSMERVYTP